MNAVEFVKKYGWEESQYISSLIMETGENVYGVEREDLHRLVESYELVMEHGSLERARKYAESPYTAPEVTYLLAKAIFDVEKFQ